MAKLTKASVFKAQGPSAETPMDKTTRIVKKMVEAEAEQRQTKNNRLRKARLEREAKTQAMPSCGSRSGSSKAAKKRKNTVRPNVPT
ncbi:hypothetical protein [uncultured Tateyamaria sp.]|uniref:hypothetical protein n=1 Tax=uncultured Tateyamaria sp. TaxID=455651 RepID=UPI00263964EC|nr:hypothetical protein [uncultured Tateyamaria sp.]